MEEPKYTTINRKDNKLLYFFDSGLDKFVALLLKILRYFVPAKYKGKFDKLATQEDLLHNVLGLALFNALGSFCVMATQVKLANYFGAAIYGVYSYCLALGEVGAMFVRYGRNKTMVRDLIQYPEKRDEIVVSTFFISIINLVLFLVVSFSFHMQLDIEVNWTYFLLIMSPCLASLTLGPLYESLKMMGWSAIYALLQKCLFLAAIWILLFSCVKVSLFSIGILMVTSWVLVYVLEYHEVITQLKINFIQRVRWSEIWNLYKDNFVIFLSCATGVAFGPLLRLILNNYADSVAVGIYAAGMQIYNICLFMNTQISRVGYPMMAQAGRADCSQPKRRRLVRNYAIIKMSACVPFAIPMVLFPSAITQALFNDEYQLIANYLPVFGVYLFSSALGAVFEQYLISMRKDKTYFSIYVATAISTIVLAFCIIPSYGLGGAIYSLVVPRIVGSLSYIFFSYFSLKNKV